MIIKIDEFCKKGIYVILLAPESIRDEGWRNYTSFSNNLKAGTYFKIVALLGACLTGEIYAKKDYRSRFTIQFNLGIGMLDL